MILTVFILASVITIVLLVCIGWRWTDHRADDRLWARLVSLQPFGGYLSEFANFGGFRLPTRIEAGNFFETDEYFPFFKVNVTRIRHPAANPANRR